METSYGIESRVSGERHPTGVDRVLQDVVEGLLCDGFPTQSREAFVVYSLQGVALLLTGRYQLECPADERRALLIRNNIRPIPCPNILVADRRFPWDPPTHNSQALSIPLLLGIIDAGESARTSDRPEFQNMLAYCKADRNNG